MHTDEMYLGNYDMYNPSHEAKKWEFFEHARQGCPVAHTSADGGGQYIVTTYDLVRQILGDPGTFSSRGVSPRPAPVTLNPLDSDPPYQIDLRKVLNPLFSRRYLLKFEPQMRAVAAALVDGWVERGEVEFVKEFAGPFTSEILAAVVFDEPDHDKMQHAAELVKRTSDESSPEAFLELAMLASQYLSDRETNPVSREDVLNAVTTATVLEGRPLTPDERLGVLTVLFLGGLDTTRGAISSIAYHLAIQSDLEARLRDPGWVNEDMDEFIRLDSPVGCLGRTVTKDVELGGVSLKAGEQVLVRFDSANRDPARFDNADRLVFDVARPAHAGFGLGIHRCLGAHLARLQIGVAIDELLKRVTNLRLVAPSDEVVWMAGIANGPEVLALRFDRVS